MSKSTPLTEAESLILAVKPKPTKFTHEYFVGSGVSEYRFLNMSSPQMREFAKSEFSFSNSNPWQAWDQIWQKTMIYDLLTTAVIWASAQPLVDQWKHRKILISWSTKADNWALADGMCSIYACLFDAYPIEMLKVLEKWSKSKNPWQRRMSIVSLFYYSRFRENLPSFSLAKKLILRQLDDDHKYIQKGVGWTLRECWNVYPKETYALLLQIADRLPAQAWTAATEKLTKPDKARLAKIRSQKKLRA